MENLPSYIPIVFGVTTIFTVVFFYQATHRSAIVLLVLLCWLALQSIIGISGFYAETDTFPPRFLLLVLPPLLFIVGLFFTPKGKRFIDGLNIQTLTLLHIVRIPVEIVLFGLFMNKAVPELMTFEGRNFDILSGMTAPFIFYFGFIKKQIDTKIILLWNFICLALLLNIVVNAVLSAPFQFQQFAFDQPNIAVLYFPFNWLPSCVVPLVLCSHLVVIRHLILNKELNTKP